MTNKTTTNEADTSLVPDADIIKGTGGNEGVEDTENEDEGELSEEELAKIEEADKQVPFYWIIQFFLAPLFLLIFIPIRAFYKFLRFLVLVLIAPFRLLGTLFSR